MDSDVTTTGQNIVCLGDFRYFAVVDRVGLNIELVPHVFGTGSNRPTGQRALYGYFRNSSGVLSVKAFRLLQVA
jgi:predicted phage gp36 major capsid-like protein